MHSFVNMEKRGGERGKDIFSLLWLILAMSSKSNLSIYETKNNTRA